MEKSISKNTFIGKIFNKDAIIKKFFNEDFVTVLKRSQLYSSSDFADAFLSSTKAHENKEK